MPELKKDYAYQRGLIDGEAKGRREAFEEAAEWHKSKAAGEMNPGKWHAHSLSFDHFRQALQEAERD